MSRISKNGSCQSSSQTQTRPLHPQKLQATITHLMALIASWPSAPPHCCQNTTQAWNPIAVAGGTELLQPPPYRIPGSLAAAVPTMWHLHFAPRRHRSSWEAATAKLGRFRLHVVVERPTSRLLQQSYLLFASSSWLFFRHSSLRTS